MGLFKIIVLVVSCIIIYMSILLPKIGLKYSKISLHLYTLLSGVGVGVGTGTFVFFGVSNRDFIGSILTGGTAAIISGLVFYFYNKPNI